MAGRTPSQMKVREAPAKFGVVAVATEYRKFPVNSLLTGNLGLPETSSLLTASSANLIFGDESHR
jgi:hypothetical protein